ncbi:MAG: dihydroorotase [Deltaproteobacteria bacterium]|nr:MAG: dihydroorotase [Deltaproteobacteria bacterium]
MTIWIKGGKIVDTARGVIQKRDIVVERGRISRILKPGVFKEKGPKLRTINASGKIIVPGLIDMHVHLREPGHEYKETIATGGKAAVVGGFVGLACMPNTEPVNDSSSVTEFILRQAQKSNLVKVYPIAAITKGQKGEALTEFGDLRQAGVEGVSDDGFPVSNSEVMRRAIEYARYYGLVVISHCEDTNLSADGVMHEGVVSTQIGLRGIPAASEEVMVQREISLAKLTGCPVHIAHVSTAGSVALIKRAKEEGVLVTAETAPHYFSLDHRAVIGYDTNAKMNPPLRTPEDVQAIKRGLAEGVLDVIATDHAPHSTLEKDLEFDRAAFGIIGLETALPLTLALVEEGVLSLPEAIKKLSHNPATILGVTGGSLREGGPADLAIIDPEEEYTLKAEDIQSRSKNSPFIGQPLRGRNLLTMIGGRIVWKRGAEHLSG